MSDEELKNEEPKKDKSGNKRGSKGRTDSVRIAVGMPLIGLDTYVSLKMFPAHSGTRVRAYLVRQGEPQPQPRTFEEWEEIIQNIN